MRTLTLFINASEYSLTMKDKIDNYLASIMLNIICLKSHIHEKQ
ncbi:hypothetical protein VR7878_03072 [Vibrio ruber DSM 16370]|uniref:Uncharacterized protein n=1 Tax=Vibrio ruber (strain DSM 16370 / JCM 11486 / BCRC 17186 / CECT 7878 / LMG 23124 / VR1) TaxID=1123498 RepID=A0A1R4LQV1_VIBR1|nr:hypothetical protein VR7878_03072 [Vibrio ruber DSM 16370]